MKTRPFKTRNATQLVFSAIGLGTAPMGEIYEVLDEKTSIATVEQALASGVRIFDTSPHYGNGIAAWVRGCVLPSEATSSSRPRSGA
jgi:D-threo-aldose 1-dehydrogenase